MSLIVNKPLQIWRGNKPRKPTKVELRNFWALIERRTPPPVTLPRLQFMERRIFDDESPTK
jgi:hypothetical protein